MRWLTVDEVCERIGISRSTWDKWRARRTGPPCKRLPNGSLRCREDHLDRWLDELDGDEAA